VAFVRLADSEERVGDDGSRSEVGGKTEDDDEGVEGGNEGEEERK
jgi:hypothetical protein